MQFLVRLPKLNQRAAAPHQVSGLNEQNGMVPKVRQLYFVVHHYVEPAFLPEPALAAHNNKRGRQASSFTRVKPCEATV